MIQRMYVAWRFTEACALVQKLTKKNKMHLAQGTVVTDVSRKMNASVTLGVGMS